MSTFKTPDKYKLSVQPGGIIVNSQLRDANLLDKLKSFFNTVKTRDLGDYDFFLADAKVVYISEKKLLTDVDTIKLKSLQNPLIIADRNTVTIDVYSKLQIVLNGCNITLFPVGHSGELPLLLHQISLAQEMHSPGTDFRINRKNPPDLPQQILLNVPGLGPTKAKNLLKKYGTVQKVAFASEQELTFLIGPSSACQLYRYFNGLVNN